MILLDSAQIGHFEAKDVFHGALYRQNGDFGDKELRIQILFAQKSILNIFNLIFIGKVAIIR